jgi:hypothetical protein
MFSSVLSVLPAPPASRREHLGTKPEVTGLDTNQLREILRRGGSGRMAAEELVVDTKEVKAKAEHFISEQDEALLEALLERNISSEKDQVTWNIQGTFSEHSVNIQ